MVTAPEMMNGPDGFDQLAHQIVSQLTKAPSPRGSIIEMKRPELTAALTSVSRAADLLVSLRADTEALRADLVDATGRAEAAEKETAGLAARLADMQSQLARATAEGAAERERADDLGRRLDELAEVQTISLAQAVEAEKRADLAEANLQHLLKVVLERLKV